jgi:hypothetical protein
MEPKVVSFPKAGTIKRAKTDADLVKDVLSAHRKLGRAIEAARRAGLTVETDHYDFSPPKITRKY